MNTELTFQAGIKDVIPTLLGYIGVGLAYGIVAQTSHLSLLTVALLCLIVYAGAAQFAITTMLVSVSPITTIILSVFLINSRMILMSTSMAQYFKQESLKANIAIGTLLTDETFALGMNKASITNGKLNFKWFNATNLVAYFVWCIACLIGVLAGNLITDPEALGLDFAIISMFIGLLYLQMISDRRRKLSIQLSVVLVVLISFIIYGRFLNTEISLLLSVLTACLVGMVLEDEH